MISCVRGLAAGRAKDSPYEVAAVMAKNVIWRRAKLETELLQSAKVAAVLSCSVSHCGAGERVSPARSVL